MLSILPPDTGVGTPP